MRDGSGSRTSAGGLAPDIGPTRALSIGIGGIVGGGFFATFGLAIVAARGATWLSFLVGGVVALLTAYSYVRLTLRYPGPSGTAGFVRLGFGSGVLPASINVLLILSYIAIMAIYARALGAYSVSHVAPADREIWTRILASAAILLLGVINFAGAGLMQRFETAFNVGKLAALAVFVVGGLLLGHPDWSRAGPAYWVPIATVISSGMVVFLSYEGFELISNVSKRIRNPERTLPIALYGSVGAAILIYVLSVVVAVGHLPFEAVEEAKSFALSAVAAQFLGAFGFGLMTIGAVAASASAINADFFGAEKLPTMLGEHGELPRFFTRTIKGRALWSLVAIGALALLAVNLIDLHALSAAASGGFLIVYAAVNVANTRLARETGSQAWISIAAGVACVAALAIMLGQFLSSPETRHSAYVVAGMAALSVVFELASRLTRSPRAS
jgi:amino acid transporter